ncbi:MAG: hypothetical protein JWQ63_3476 [Mucilaginibacter sp.]|jgi:gliding motility-associated-like protein|nr:hypothetical protein [Mucilaginibacter sp.]
MTRNKAVVFLCFFLLFFCKTYAVFAQVPNISYQTPQIYTINTAITPLKPTNTGGVVPTNAYGQVSTFAGTGKIGSANGPVLIATFNQPRDAAVDLNGNIYVIDDNNTIRKVTPAGIVVPFAGSGILGFADGIGSAASFGYPSSLTVDKSGNVYVADNNNHAIRKITPSGVVSTLAGNGTKGFSNGIGASATFNYPDGIAVDTYGNVFVADQFNWCIRKITPSGVVSTFAGNGNPGSIDGISTQASFSQLTSLAIDAAGNIYATDEDNNEIRKITPSGTVSTIAGNGIKGSADGLGNLATFNLPVSIALDAANNLYVGDAFNQLIRKITPAGLVTTIAGNGTMGFVNGIGINASFSYPYGIATDNLGNIYIADNQNNCFREISLTGYTIDKPLPSGLTFDPTTGIISGTPTAVLPATVYTITAYNAGGSSTTTVNITVTNVQNVALSPISAKTVCDADFDPGATGNSTINYTSANTAVATIVAGKIHIIDAGTSVITASNGSSSATQTLTVIAALTPTVNISPSSVDTCQSNVVTFTASITNGGNNPTYVWQVNGQSSGANGPQFTTSYLNNNDQITCILNSDAICTTNNLAISNTATITINPPVTASVKITSSATSPICAGTEVTFTAISANGGSNPAYQWQINELNAGNNNPVFTSNTLADGDIVTCSLSSSAKCLINSNLQSNAIKINLSPVSACLVVIPNTFTPNGDGINDLWDISSLQSYPYCNVTVFNRYGTLIYNSIGYPKSWDGTYNGKVLPVGTYFYIIDLKNGKNKLTGPVTILR